MSDKTEEKAQDTENGGQGQSEAHEAAEKAKQEYEDAQQTMEEWEQKDDLPTDLEEWPSDKAKYVTFGGGEGDHGYDEGPEPKLGPSEVRHEGDGKVTVQGEEVDNPEEFKGDPIPGGPTDPEAPELAGEKRKREKQGRMTDRGDDDVPTGSAEKEPAAKDGDSEG
jgi:hypothetical protein